MFVKLFQQITYWPTLFLLRLFFDYRIEGRENLKGLEDKAVIFASNHASYLDGPVCGIALPRGGIVPKTFRPIRFLAYEKYCNWKTSPLPFPFSVIGALYIKINGSIPVREGLGDLNFALRDAIKCLKDSGKVWIYPEGRVSSDGKLGKGKRGIAFLHKETKAVIVPVGLINTHKVHTFKKFFSRPKIIARFGEPIYYFENSEALEKNIGKIMARIEKLVC